MSGLGASSLPDMKTIPPLPDTLAQQASFLTPQERQRLWQAAIIMADARGPLLRLTSLFGRRVDELRKTLAQTGGRLGGESWDGLTSRAQALVEDTLWTSYRYATFGLEATQPPSLTPPINNRFHRLVTTASGLASGFIGLPGVLFDIPFTTTTILRSIAEVARDCGEDLRDEETRRACLSVLAFGGPGSEDDEAEIGYWVTRLGVNHLTINLLIRNTAAQFGIVLSEKFLAQAVPLTGALAGGALNCAFTTYYQDMARVQFCLRALARRCGDPEALQRSFVAMLEQARTRHHIPRRPAAAPIPPLLPAL